MKIFIVTFSGRSITMEVDPQDKVASIKAKLQDREGVQPEEQRLLFQGKQLEDEYTLDDYQIEKNSTVHLVIRVRGGIQVVATSNSIIFDAEDEVRERIQ